MPPGTRALVPALVACSVLGVFGTVSGFLGLLSWDEPLEPLPLVALPERPAGIDPEAWRRIEEVHGQLPAAQLEVVRRRRPALNALAVVNLVASASLLVGTQLARRRTPGGLSALRTGLGLSEAYAAIALGVNMVVQREIIDTLRPQIDRLAEIPGLSAQVAATFQATRALSAAVLLAQLAFYVWMHWYVGRPHVAAVLRPHA